MRHYGEADSAYLRRQISLPHPQSVAQISEDLAVGVSVAGKFTVVMTTAGHNGIELGDY